MADLFERLLNPEALNNYTASKVAKRENYYPYFHPVTTRQHSEVVMDGRRTVMLGSNNYLGLTSDERVIEAAKRAIDKYGTGCTGSRFMNGTLDLHMEMEERLAAFFGKEAVITFPSGFQTNLGIVSAVTGRHDILFYDHYNHASLVDAARLSFARLAKFEHNDMQELEQKLQDAPDSAGRLIVVDGVYSMEGDLCDLPAIAALARKYGARVMVDDSHGIGTMGKGGRGVGEHFGMMDGIDILMGTFSKSFASLGGFMAASREVVEYVKHMSRPFIFSASMPPSAVAAVLESLRILQEEPQIVARVNENAQYMREGFARLNIPFGNSAAPIVPVMTYQSERTFLVTRALLEHGVCVNPVVAPAVPEGSALLRTSYTASQNKEQLDYALTQFDAVFNKLYPIHN